MGYLGMDSYVHHLCHAKDCSVTLAPGPLHSGQISKVYSNMILTLINIFPIRSVGEGRSFSSYLSACTSLFT